MSAPARPADPVDFELTDDQVELQRVVREVVDRECPPALLRSVLDGTGDGEALWATYVGLDWPSLTVAEEDGGMGFTAVELALVLEELGRVADPTPFAATTSQFVPMVRACGDGDQRRALLGPVCSGRTGAAAFAAGTVTATPSAGGWTLQGTADHVLDGDRADEIAVVAATTDPAVPRAAFVVPGAAVAAERRTSFDGTLHLASIALDGVAVPAERALLGGGPDALDRAHQEAVTGLAAIMVGASQRVFDLALGHIRDRRQFGAPIGSFQALKHLAVDVHVALERARALHHYAALTIAEDDPSRVLAAAMAKAAAGDAQRIAVQHGVQFFGGLGYTWENDLHLYARRAKAGELLLGTAAEHKAVVARLALPRYGSVEQEALR